jgi:hypothetical protein
MGAKHAEWFVRSTVTTGWLRETELVPKTQGIVSAVKQTKFALGLLKHGKVPPPVPPHVADRVDEARALFKLVKEQGVRGSAGIVQGERAIARIEQMTDGGSHGGWGSRDSAEITPGRRETAARAD